VNAKEILDNWMGVTGGPTETGPLEDAIAAALQAQWDRAVEACGVKCDETGQRVRHVNGLQRMEVTRLCAEACRALKGQGDAR
jgi:hypothetical protein